MNPPETIAGSVRHAGPHLGLVAIVFTALKFASLVPVSAFGFAFGIKPPYFPGSTAPGNDVVAYFDTHRLPVLICAFLQFGATVPLGIFTATIVSRLHFLGVKAAGVHIALFGGLAVAFDSAASAFVLWTMAQTGITQDASLVRALYYLQSDDQRADRQSPQNRMNSFSERAWIRTLHLVLSIPIIGFIYGPVAHIPPAASFTRLIAVPIVALSD